jgi:hypothetical protein
MKPKENSRKQSGWVGKFHRMMAKVHSFKCANVFSGSKNLDNRQATCHHPPVLLRRHNWDTNRCSRLTGHFSSETVLCTRPATSSAIAISSRLKFPTIHPEPLCNSCKSEKIVQAFKAFCRLLQDITGYSSLLRQEGVATKNCRSKIKNSHIVSHQRRSSALDRDKPRYEKTIFLFAHLTAQTCQPPAFD